MVIFIHIILAISFFYILNWIGRHTVSLGYQQLSIFAKSDEAPAYNFILRALSPTVFILIISTLFYSLKYDCLVKNIWLIVVYYFIFRTLFNIAYERIKLINWRMQILQWAVAIPISYLTYNNIIVTKKNLFPDLQTIGNELWFIILLFLYATFNNIRLSEEATRRRKLNYLTHVYKKYSRKYSQIIKKKLKTSQLEILIYAIMIYEAFARPKIFRILENLFFPFNVKTLGIMQIETNKKISDKESVQRAIDKIKKDYKDALKINKPKRLKKRRGSSVLHDSEYTERQVLYDTVAKYNKDEDYIDEVMQLYDQIKKEFYDKK